MGRTLLVASPGGHLDELYDFVPRLDGVGTDRVWVTARTPQTRCILDAEVTEWVAPVASRQGVRALARLPQAISLVRRYRPDLVVSTGAALATPYLVAARMLGVETHYIESATRMDGPSLTGRIMTRIPKTRLHHQGFREPAPGWAHVGSVFDAYTPGPTTDRPVRRVVVTLGTERYPFVRALVMISGAVPLAAELLFQTGHTPLDDRVRDASYRRWVPYDELTRAVAQADVCISHAGVGSVLSALRAGKHPLVIPRRADLGEHVDNHQLELARILHERGLVTVAPRDGNVGPLLEDVARRSTAPAVARSIGL